MRIEVINRHGVSIHAPLRREERLVTSDQHEQRNGFNPRPPPKRGATR